VLSQGDEAFPYDDGSLLGDVPVDPEESIEIDDDGNVIRDGLALMLTRASRQD